MSVSVQGTLCRYPASVEAALYFAIIDVLDPVDPAEAAVANRASTVTVNRVGDDLVATVAGGRTSLVRVPHPVVGGG
jgi:hypothetical protein